MSGYVEDYGRTMSSRSDRRERAQHLGPERRRPMVLDAALRLFTAAGYQGTSMEAIAEAAGVTKPVVYECYPSKAELFRALLERAELEIVAAGAWGNRECVIGNFSRWSAYRRWHPLRNEPEYPVQVWAFARRSADRADVE